MKFVEIYKLQNDGSQIVFATCKLVNDKIVIESSEKFASTLEKMGIRNYAGNEDKNLFPKDGILFLEQLPYNFKSGYMNASAILEK